MERLKQFFYNHFEKVLVFAICFGILAINFFGYYKIAYLNFFYLPILLAGYYIGVKAAILTSVFCISSVLFFLVKFPTSFFVAELDKTYLMINLIVWSVFLILTSAALGYLYEEKERLLKDISKAHSGVLAVLSKYLETSDQYTKGHSVRVSHLSADIAKIMKLSKEKVTIIKTAGLLHDIGKTQISLDIINKASSLNEGEREIMASHSERGAKLLSMMGGLLQEAIPIVSAHHKYYFQLKDFSSEEKKSIPLGTSIIAVADTYDAIVTDRSYRKGKLPWEAYTEIEKGSGKQFNPEVVSALKTVLLREEKYIEEKDGEE
ncbi:HD-GYP domain-containing protein [Chlamydiota bacterium]